MTQPNNATTPSERKFVCQPCDKRYSCLSHLNRHKTESREHKERIRQMKTSNPKETDSSKDKSDQKFSCQPCGKSFDYAWQLNIHKESSHHQSTNSTKKPKLEDLGVSPRQKYDKIGVIPPTDKVFPCETCGKIFIHALSLSIHAKTHSQEIIDLSEDEYQDKEDQARSGPGSSTPGEKKFVCHTCDKSYSCLSHLKRHEQTSKEHKDAVKRSLTKESSEDLDISVKKVSKEQQDDDSFNEIDLLSEDHQDDGINQTVPSTPGKEKFTCHTCDKSYSSIFNLKRHEKNNKEHKEAVKRCKSNEIDLVSGDEQDDKKDEAGINQTVSGTPGKRKFTCHICATSFLSNAHLKRHEQTGIHKEAVRKGKENFEMNFEFSIEDFSEHEDNENRPSKRRNMRASTGQFACQTCMKTFAKASSLRDHEKSHIKADTKTEEETSSKHSCKTCGRNFDRASSLTNHEKSHTSNSRRKSVACPTEEKKQADEEDKKPQSNDEEFHTCQNCTESFVSLADLKKHTYWNPFSCKLCSKCFHNPKSFELHKSLKHAGEENLDSKTCQTCRASFAARSDLKKHLYWGCKGF